MTGTMHIVLSVILAVVLLLPARAKARPACRAIDGDSLACGHESVHIIGLDAQELRGRCHAETRLARAAHAQMQQLVARGVTLGRRGRDRYRRTLAVVRARGWQDVAAIMIRERLARPYDGTGPRRGWC